MSGNIMERIYVFNFGKHVVFDERFIKPGE